MRNIKRQLREGESGAGSVSTVTREGNTVRRPVGPWTSSVQALLQHLEEKSYPWSPRVISADADGETLTYIEGETGHRPWPSCLLDDAGIEAIGRALGEYHEAVADFVPPPGSVWRSPDRDWAPGMIVRHGDLGPWNMIWRENQLVGIIDWDMAEPGSRIEDLAQVAWHCIPLARASLCESCGLRPGLDQKRRLSILCGIFNVPPLEILVALQSLQKAETERTLRLSKRGIEPWSSFHARGDILTLTSDQEWLADYLTKL